MSYKIITRLVRLAILTAFQVLVVNQVHIMGYITPLILGYMLICFHRGSSRIGILLWGFAIGFIFDIFSNTAGMASAACTLVAMVQQPLLEKFVSHDAAEDVTPSIRTLSFGSYISYVFILNLILHAVFYALDAFTFHNWQLTLIAIGGGTVISTIVTIFIEFLVRTRKSGSRE